MSLTDFYYNTRKSWTVGPILLNGSTQAAGSIYARFWRANEAELSLTISAVVGATTAQASLAITEGDLTAGDYQYDHYWLDGSGNRRKIEAWTGTIRVIGGPPS